MTLLKASIVFTVFLGLQGCVEGQMNFAGEVICRNYEGDGLCPKLSHFESQLTLAPSDDLEARLSYDPAQSRKATWYDSLDLNHLNLPPQRSWLADYAIEWMLDPRWTLQFEDASGTTLIPDASYLAFARNLQDIGWKQSAGRLSFDHKDIFEGDLMLGLGEGERLESDDDELFYGARFRWYMMKAFGLQLAYSQDKNSLPKDAIWWQEDRRFQREGFESRRWAATLLLNGKLPSARGLEASVGWQENRIERQGSRAGQSFTNLPSTLALDPTELLAEDLGGSGPTKRQTLYLSASYRILAEYILAFHHGIYTATLNDNRLTVCRGLDLDGNCVEATETRKALRLQEWTYGLGKIDNDGWTILLESHEERYDRLYQNFHFLSGRSPRQKNMRLIQGRITWNW